MTSTEAPPRPAQGWHPDPAGSGGMRWWDGNGWTDHVAPPPPAHTQTEAFAIVAFVIGLCGGVLLSIIFGLIARSRIKNSGGLKTGKGLANAGIALSFVWLAIGITFVALAASGSFDQKNADDFSGPKRDVAVQVDQFEQLIGDHDGEAVCTEILTVDYARAFDQSGAGCVSNWTHAIRMDQRQAEIDVHSIDIAGDHATAQVDEGGLDERLEFRYENGEWRLDDIVAH